MNKHPSDVGLEWSQQVRRRSHMVTMGFLLAGLDTKLQSFCDSRKLKRMLVPCCSLLAWIWALGWILKLCESASEAVESDFFEVS